MPNGLYFMAVFFPFLLSFLQRLISEVTERISIKLGTHIHANVDVLFTSRSAIFLRHTIAQGGVLMPIIVAGDAPFLLKFICAESDPPPFEHNDFDQYRLIVPQPS